MLPQIGLYNDLSLKLREQLEKRIASFGKSVRYKFNISHPNPDPQKHNGEIIWPNVYTLDPSVFRITDNDEDRKDKQKVKLIANVKTTDDKGVPNSFNRLRVGGKEVGIKIFDLEKNPDDVNMVAWLELHPKLSGGLFADQRLVPVCYRIDEVKEAQESRSKRQVKIEALSVAANMKDKEIKEFADAMLWSETNDMNYLRDEVEKVAEESPEAFNDLVKGKKIEYQAVVKRALDNQVIGYDPVESKYTMISTNQTLAILGFTENKNHVEAFAEWLMVNGTKADAIYKKIKSLVAKEPEPTT